MAIARLVDGDRPATVGRRGRRPNRRRGRRDPRTPTRRSRRRSRTGWWSSRRSRRRASSRAITPAATAQRRSGIVDPSRNATSSQGEMALPTCDQPVGRSSCANWLSTPVASPTTTMSATRRPTVTRPPSGGRIRRRGRRSRGREELEGPVDPRQHAITAQGDERVEQRRRRRPTGDRDADGHEQVAGLPAAGLGQGAQRRLELVRLEGQLARCRRGPPGRPSGRRGSWPRPSASGRAWPGRARPRRPTGTRRGRRSHRASAAVPGPRGAGRAQLVVATASGRSARRPARPRRTGGAGRSGRPASRRRIHWPLSHSSRSRSKTAPPLWTAWMSNRSTISSSERTSSSVPVDQPRSAR